ncbi:serine protease [Symmachiella dynata]|uniref:S1C family serine protease n=1 Tax=Symmachiella dynata TaxID=2527995 RepID=UPI0030EB260C
MKTLNNKLGGKTVATTVALIMMLAATQTAFADAKVYQRTLKSTTWIIAKAENGYSTGSGVLVDAEKKWVVTNFHVVGASKEVLIFFPQFQDDQLIAERQHYIDGADMFGIRARVVMVDKKRDLAVVELNSIPENTPAIEIAETSIGPGEMVHSIGNPTAGGVLWTYTSGSVRSVYRKQFRTQAGEHDMRVVETTSPINPGDSGGPVVNAAGELVAISQSLDPKARLMSYCVEITEAKTFVAEVVDYTTVVVPDVLAKSGLTIVPQGKTAFSADLQADGGETQRVFISAKLESFGKAETRKVWSLATVSPQAPTLELLTTLMEQSARTKLGAWVIEKNEAGQYLVIFCAKVDAGSSPESLRNSVEFVSKVAASMKQQITANVTISQTKSSSSDWLGSR